MLRNLALPLRTACLLQLFPLGKVAERSEVGCSRSHCLLLGPQDEVVSMQYAQPADSNTGELRRLLGDSGFFPLSFLCFFLLRLGCRDIPAQGGHPLIRFHFAFPWSCQRVRCWNFCQFFRRCSSFFSRR